MGWFWTWEYLGRSSSGGEYLFHPYWGAIIGTPIVLLVVLILLFGTFFTIETQSAGIIQRFGKFHRIAEAGLHAKRPFIDQVVSELDLRLLNLVLDVTTKTEDNVFVTLRFSVQYRVRPDAIADAHYKLEDEEKQIIAYVGNTARAKVPKMTLKGLYESDADLAQEIKGTLETVMGTYGYQIESTLLTAIAPDAKVQESLNQIQAATNLREAAAQKAEATRITIVKQAEAEAEAKELAGKGIAKQRKAIVDGLAEAVQHFSDDTQIDKDEVLMTILLTQYFDTLHALGMHGVTTVLMPHSPGGLTDILGQLRATLTPATRTAPADAAAA